MDRITRALELARKSHQSIPPTFVEHGKVINYSHTQQVEVSDNFLKQQKVISSFKNEPIADSYRLLRTRVLQRMKQNNWQAIGVTSPGPDVGKTLTAINLAIAISMEHNHSALLVDADLRNPSVHRMFNLQPEHGLTDYLANDFNVADLLLNPGIANFVMLPCQENSVGSSELLTSSKMVRLVDELKSRYSSRVVLFDMPDILVSDDVIAFSAHLDAVLIVVEDGKTLSSDLRNAMDLLDGVNILGTVLNKAKEASLT